MELSRVAPELRDPMLRITRIPIPMERSWGRRVIQTLLAVMPITKLDGVSIERPRDAAPLVRVYHPAVRRSPAALFWIHGGGLIIGRAVQDDHLCGLTARELGIVVVSVEYRKAPRYPFPAALDDCLAGWRWLQREAPHFGVDPSCVAVGGESAGGGLAASLAQRLHGAGGASPVAQWLFCPMLDDRTAALDVLDAANHFVWNNRLNRFGWRSYLGEEPGAATVPAYAVPARREDLRGLPPAWIGVGDIDLFYGENRHYADRLREAAVDVTMDVVPGAPHGITSWAFGASIVRDHIRRAQAWLGQTLERCEAGGQAQD
ncbi:MAG TPA: alpha/beta hydrolase [Ktedonobacterales bacterium]|jgi:acetyl esterase/lipase|nr:alpha/beta hydrolase [Ktedonobacterales bacterium]